MTSVGQEGWFWKALLAEVSRMRSQRQDWGGGCRASCQDWQTCRDGNLPCSSPVV